MDRNERSGSNLENSCVTLDDREDDVVPFFASGGSGEPLESENFFMHTTAWKMLVCLKVVWNALTALTSAMHLSSS